MKSGYAVVGRLLLLAVLSSSGVTVGSSRACAETGSPSDATYRLDLAWDARARQLSGTESIAFTNTGSGTLDTIWLRLWPNAYGSCRRQRIAVGNVVGGTAGPLAVDCTALPIVLSRPLAQGETGQITLDLTATVPRGRERYGVHVKTALLGSPVPLLAVTDSRGLHLEPNAPLGEAMYSLTAAWNVALTIPAGMEAATTGTVSDTTVLADGRKRLTIVAPTARDFSMAIGPFQIHSTTVEGVELRYFEPAHPKVPAATVLDWATQSFTDYSRRYGSYGASELDIAGVPKLVGDGMEYPEMVMTELVRDTVSHEIAHQWFYGMVGNNQALEPWLDESFTEFLSERVWGENLDCDVDDPWAGSEPEPLDASMAFFETVGVEYYNIIYFAGPCVLERLRRDWDDRRFDRFMESYVADHRFGVTTTPELKAAIRASAPRGYDVDAFFTFARLTTWPG